MKQLKIKKRRRIEPDTPAVSLSSRRIVLLGKTGVGRSSAANTILGWKEFRCMRGMTPVTSVCSVKHATVSDRLLSVVDTPGLYHTEMRHEELKKEIMRSVYLSRPGPHAFLIVFRVDDRFTEQDQQIPQMTEMMFGEEVLKYSIILFTHGDQLDVETVEELIKKNSILSGLVDQCRGRFHVFNNTKRNSKQVNDLLQKIDTMIEQNGGGHYSHQIIEDAQRLRQEEERKQQEEKQRQEEIEKVRKETEERVRAEFEGPPRFLLERLKAMSPMVILMEKKMHRDVEWQRKQRGEKQRQEEIERVRKETEVDIREEFEGPPRFLLERLKAMRLRDEERRRREEERRHELERLFDHLHSRKREEKQRQEEIERVRKETEERVRAEFEGPPRFLLERLKATRLSLEDRIRRQVERQEMFGIYFSLFFVSSMRHLEMRRELQEEIERVIKETDERIRAEFEGPPR
ncbi:hypothetical protein PO909_000835 [Leuciscus waleckii]